MSGSSTTTDHPMSCDSGTTFNLPLPSNVLFLTFKNVSGPTMSGTVDIVTSPDQPHNVASVLVFVRYAPENIFEGCKVNMVHRGEGEIGVEVYVFDWVRQQSGARLSFEIKAILPECSDSPLVIKRFETDVGNAVQKVGDLKDKVLFQSLSLKATNGDIHVGSLKADQGRIETSNGVIHGQFHSPGELNLSTSNGDIRGQFHTSGELNLSTSNGTIRAEVELTSIEGSKAKVSMGSKNGDIDSNINLCSSSGSEGSFEASTTTSNGHVNVKFPISPPDSKLKFVGESKNGDIDISLNPAYEGIFNLKSSGSKPTVDENERQDPSGKNRKRVVSKHPERYSAITGKTYWEEAWVQPKLEGTVDAQTKNGEVVLTL